MLISQLPASFVSYPLHQIQLIGVSINFESSQLALRLSPYIPFDEGANYSHRKWELKKTNLYKSISLEASRDTSLTTCILLKVF